MVYYYFMYLDLWWTFIIMFNSLFVIYLPDSAACGILQEVD